MSVFKKYKGKRIQPDDPNWDRANWWIYTRINGTVLHKSLRGVANEEQAREIEMQMIRKIASKVEANTANKIARRINRERGVDRPEYIYFLESGGFVKIGRTVEIEKRWKAIADTIIPFETKIIFVLAVADSKYVEKYLHDLYTHCRTKGEWFLFDARELEQIMRRALDVRLDRGRALDDLQPSSEKELQDYP